jgi:hypothetical protein
VLVSTGDLSMQPLAVNVTLTVEPAAAQGQLQGMVRDAETGAPLAGVIEVDERLSITLDASGAYSLTLPARQEIYRLSTDIVGYVDDELTLAITDSLTSTLDFELMSDIPRLSIGPAVLTGLLNPDPITETLDFQEKMTSNIIVRNSGTQPLSYKTSVPAEAYGVWRSDEPGGLTTPWQPLPLGAEELVLEDDGSSEALPLGFAFSFGGQTYEEVYIASNGILSFEPLPEQRFFSSSCLPVPEADTTAIVPLRIDMDPSQGGTVRWAQSATGFTVNYEDVPLHSEDPSTAPRFNVQVMLEKNNNIVIHYGNLGDLPPTMAVGVQRDRDAVQLIGCGIDTPITSSLRLELRPQPDAREWLSITTPTSATIQPRVQRVLDVQIEGAFASKTGIYRSAVVIESNDPRQPIVRVPVEVRVQPPSTQIWLPLLRRVPGS